jgi:hypothetical protein
MKAKIKIKNGYWTYNGVPVKDCSFPIQKLVASYIKQTIFETEPREHKQEKKEFILEKSSYNFNFERVN